MEEDNIYKKKIEIIEKAIVWQKSREDISDEEKSKKIDCLKKLLKKTKMAYFDEMLDEAIADIKNGNRDMEKHSLSNIFRSVLKKIRRKI